MISSLLYFTIVVVGINILNYSVYNSIVNSKKDIGIEVNNIRNMADTGVQTILNKDEVGIQTVNNKVDISIQTGDDLLNSKLSELAKVNEAPSVSMEEMSPTEFINTFRKDPSNADYFNKIADWTLGVNKPSTGNTDLDSQINFLKRVASF